MNIVGHTTTKRKADFVDCIDGCDMKQDWTYIDKKQWGGFLWGAVERELIPRMRINYDRGGFIFDSNPIWFFKSRVKEHVRWKLE